MTEQSETDTPGIPQWDLADRMRKALRQSGLSAGEIARYLGVGRNTVSTWINGRIEPSLQTLRLWALRTGVSFEWLRYGYESTSAPPPGPGKSVNFRGSVNSGNMSLFRLAA